MSSAVAERRDSGRFGVVVLAGLATSGLTAVAAANPWFRASGEHRMLGLSDAGNEADMPLALACALVVLAAWGVVLVTGARTRRVVLAVGMLAGVGVLACVVRAPALLHDQIADRLGAFDGEIQETGWYVVACVAVVLTLAAMVAGWRLAPRWPTMSSRYDAPAAGSVPVTTADADELTLWKAFDEGRDPTQS